MTKQLLSIALTMLVAATSYAQTKIKDGTVIGSPSLPNSGAILDVESANKGILHPRVPLTSTTVWGLAGTSTAGMVVYNNSAAIVAGSASYPIAAGGIGLYYWDGGGWVAMKMTTADFWKLTGNTATNPGTNGVGATADGNYLGTTDKKNLVLGVNGIKSFILDTIGNGVGGADNILNLTNPLGFSGRNFMWGEQNTIDNSNGSVNGYWNNVFGFLNKTNAASTTIFGTRNTDNNPSQDMGYNFISGEENTITDPTGQGAQSNTVLGSYNTLTAANDNMVLGTYNTANNLRSSGTLIGIKNTLATDSGFAIGILNTVNHNQSFAIGTGATTDKQKQFSANFSGGYHLIGIGRGATSDSLVTDSLGYIRHRSITAYANNFWGTAGNAGTTPPTTIGAAVGANNYWGTTDAQNLAVGTGGITRMIFDQNSNAFGGAAGSSVAFSTSNGGNNRNFIWGRNNQLSDPSNLGNANANAIFGANNTVVSGGTFYGSTNLVGGGGNKVASSSAIVGGSNNTDSALYSIVGGMNNFLDRSGGNSLLMGGGPTIAEGNYLSGAGSAMFGSTNEDSASYTLISGYNNGVSPGSGGTVVTGENNQAKAASIRSLITGYSNTAYNAAHAGIFGGQNEDSAQYTLVSGESNKVSSIANNTQVAGRDNIVKSPFSMIGGDGNTSTGSSVAVFGWNNKDSADYTLISGNSNIISAGAINATALGNQNTATGQYSTVVGQGNIASSNFELISGRFNAITTGSAATWVGTDALVQVGIGTNTASRANALTILKNGYIAIGSHTAKPNSTLQVNGSMSINITTVSTTYTVLPTDYTVLFEGQTAPFTCTLPDPTTCKGRILIFCNYGTQATAANNTVTLSTPTGNLKYRTGAINTVYTATSYPLGSGLYATGGGGATAPGFTATWKMTFQSSGTDWYIIGNEP